VIHNPDGSVTFQKRGFVSAPSPSMLLARHNHEIARIREELAGVCVERSLEVGCGFGRLSMTFAENSQQHHAVDINDDALAEARVCYQRVNFQKARAQALPFPDNYFGLVSTWTVVQHIRPEQVDTACTEIKRVLAPGGLLLMCEGTRYPEARRTDTWHNRVYIWHRRVSEYERLLAPLILERHGYIEEIDAIAGLEAPGEVMLFRS